MKELRDYLKILKKYRILLISLAIVATGATWLWLGRQPATFQATTTLYVNRLPETSTGSYYTFAGYYSGLAAKEYTDVVVGMLKTQDLVRLAAGKVGESTDANSILGQMAVRKIGPQLITVSLKNSDSSQAKKLLTAVAEVVNERSKSLNQSGNQGIEVTMINPEPVVAPQSLPTLIYFSISILGSLIVGLAVILIREYFLV